MKKAKNKTSVGVIVGRFQCPYLHVGHLDLICRVCARHSRVIIFLGASPLRCTRYNTFDTLIRTQMIKERFPNVEVYDIRDVGDKELWSKNLDIEIKKKVGCQRNVVLYGSRESFLKAYSGTYSKEYLAPVHAVSASEVRRFTSLKPKHTQDFREGMVYTAYNKFPSCLATVDVAIVDMKRKRLLIARKPTQKLFRFVGGFSDVNSSSYEADAKREVKEETCLDVGDPLYIGSCLIDDWRYEHEADKIKTLFFVANYLGGVPKANDDIAEVKWVGFAEMDKSMFVETHHPLFDMFEAWIIKDMDNWSRTELYQILKQPSIKSS